MLLQTEISKPKTRVLIVDDEQDHRNLLKEILYDPEYLITEARDGREALGLIADGFNCDLILLDKRMPGMSGDEVCAHIRQHRELDMVPIIMVTATNDDRELYHSMKLGANDFIRKPYTAVELLSRVAAAVRQKRRMDELDSAETLLFALARMVEAKDGETGDHCTRLSHLAVVFGEALGLGARELKALRQGGVLHDLGKLAIPDEVLLKKGPLDDGEWAIMRQHTVVGAELCKDLHSVQDVVPIIRSHHERWQGGGYPDGLVGEEIPLLARVFQFCDIYDALASARPYKPAWPRERVIAMFEEEVAKGWRDPELAAPFLEILRDRPSILQLPQGQQNNLGESLFDSVRATGVFRGQRILNG